VPRYNGCLQDIDSMLRRAGQWFLRSGIQQAGGGVARYYRSDLGKNARVSTEITGYAVNTLLYLAGRTADGNYTDAAMRAARFLTETAWSPLLSTFPFEHSDNGAQPEPLAYFFDCGIIVRGLLAAWRASREQRFLDTAATAGRAMIADFDARSAIHPILRLPEKQPLAYETKWSASPGCYQLKSAMAWYDLFDETGERRFATAYEQALENALRSEGAFLPGDADREKVMDRLHAYCYFLEGLLPYCGRSEVSRVLSAGIEKTAKYLHDIATEFARSDVYAQLLRVRLCAAHAGAVPLDETQASCEAARAGEFQLASDDPRIEGGFAFGRKAEEILPFVNPVSTGFCVQALVLWHDRQNGTLKPSRQALI
jgi:hypothetical protein